MSPAKVHTLKDLEKRDSSRGSHSVEPFPDPWARYPAQFDPSRAPEGYEMRTSPMVQFSYVGIDGKKKTVQQTTTPSIWQMCCLGCCPCIVPPLCSPEKRQEYLGALKSFSWIITIIDVILLIVALAMGGFAPPKDNPTFGPPTETLVQLGAKDTALIQDGHVYRLVTPIFLHAGLIHLLFNGMAQVRVGLYLERQWGLLLFIPLYFISGIFGNLFSCVMAPSRIGVGASGWQKTDPRERKMQLIQLIIVIVLVLLLSFSKYVDFGAHLGGLVCGMLMGLAYFSKENHIPAVQKFGPIVAVIALIMLGALFLLLLFLVV